MTVQHSDTVRQARLNAIESTIGATPFLDLRSGTQPADCSQAATGTLIAHIALPSDWLANAAGGTKVLSGIWSGSAIADGVVSHYRIMNAANTVCHEQGSVTAASGGGDLELDNTNVANSQTVTISAWSYTEGNP